MNGVFVTGTDTGVGKTVVAAVLVRAWQASATGSRCRAAPPDGDDDTATVVRLAGLPPGRPPRRPTRLRRRSRRTPRPRSTAW